MAVDWKVYATHLRGHLNATASRVRVVREALTRTLYDIVSITRAFEFRTREYHAPVHLGTHYPLQTGSCWCGMTDRRPGH